MVLGKLFCGFAGLQVLRWFLQIHNNKIKTKGNVNLLLKGGWTLVREDAQKVELLNAFFQSVFTGNTSPQESLTQETRVKECKTSASSRKFGLENIQASLTSTSQ